MCNRLVCGDRFLSRSLIMISKIFFDMVQHLVWKYLSELNSDEYRKSVPVFNSFLDYLCKELGIE